MTNLAKVLHGSRSPLRAVEKQLAEEKLKQKQVKERERAKAEDPDPLGYYDMLGLDVRRTGAKRISVDDIKSAYRAAAMRLHPDTVMSSVASGSSISMDGSDNVQVITLEVATTQFQTLQEAYEVLKVRPIA